MSILHSRSRQVGSPRHETFFRFPTPYNQQTPRASIPFTAGCDMYLLQAAPNFEERLKLTPMDRGRHHAADGGFKRPSAGYPP